MNILTKEPSDILELLKKNKLFGAADKASLLSLAESGQCKVYICSRGEVVYSPGSAEKMLISVISGSAAVYSVDESRNVLLRTLGASDVVGVANLFSEGEFVSRIIANEKTKLFAVTEEGVRRLIESDVAFTYRYIGFLSDRIAYLNKKIVFLTAGSAERRLAYFLDSLSREDEFILPIPMSDLADMLNVGRASLYRAADKLCEEGFIIRDGKKITVTDRAGMLERYI